MLQAAHRPPCCQSCGFDRRRGCFREDICELKCPLRKIAGGSVGQEFEIWKEERGVGKVTWGILRFNMLFEEIFDFQLEFVECAARDLHAADEGGTSDPYVNISIKG